MTTALITISICVVLPIAIVLINSLTQINSDNKRAQIILKAIEANKNVDIDKLTESLNTPQKPTREILNNRLFRCCIFTLLGIGFVIYFLYNKSISGNPNIINYTMLLAIASFSVGLSYFITYLVMYKQMKSDTSNEQ